MHPEIRTKTMKKIYVLSLSLFFAAAASAQNNGLNVSASADVNASSAVALTDGIDINRASEKVQVYSFDNQVYINVEGVGAINGQVQVYDLLGKMVTTANFRTSNFVLPVAVQSSSLYIVNVTVNGNSTSQKLYIK